MWRQLQRFNKTMDTTVDALAPYLLPVLIAYLLTL